MSEVETALLGALLDLQHPGNFDRTAVVRQTDAELSWAGSVSPLRCRQRSKRRRLPAVRQRRKKGSVAGRDTSRWFGLRQCQDQTDNIMKLDIVLPYSGNSVSCSPIPVPICHCPSTGCWKPSD